ncbi:MAG: hypothetical protein ACLFTG_16315, partial [Alphaproteobacteria bacterium]
ASNAARDIGRSVFQRLGILGMQEHYANIAKPVKPEHHIWCQLTQGDKPPDRTSCSSKNGMIQR